MQITHLRSCHTVKPESLHHLVLLVHKRYKSDLRTVSHHKALLVF